MSHLYDGHLTGGCHLAGAIPAELRPLRPSGSFFPSGFWYHAGATSATERRTGMANEALEILDHLQKIGGQIRSLAERTLKEAANLPPSEGELVRKSVAKLMTFSERLHEIATTNEPSLDGLRLGLDEAPWSYLDTAIETLERLRDKTDDEPLR
jgi:hypothetical protein